MKNTQLILLELAVLFISSLFLMTNSVHLQAFQPVQLPQSPFISPTIPPGPESSPQPAIPPLQPSSPPQPAIPQQEPGASLTAQGTINSLISAPQNKWIATGNWSIDVNNGQRNIFYNKYAMV